MSPPDVLWGGYIDGYYQEKLEHPPVLPVVMKPLVFTYLVRYEFSAGVGHVSVARGALAGNLRVRGVFLRLSCTISAYMLFIIVMAERKPHRTFILKMRR